MRLRDEHRKEDETADPGALAASFLLPLAIPVAARQIMVKPDAVRKAA